MTTAWINRIGTATPPNEVHGIFIGWAAERVADPRRRALFERMAERAGIGRRWSVLAPGAQGDQTSPDAFYGGAMPSTDARMRVYAAEAPRLAHAAVAALGEIGAVSHLVVASCTGFTAPGIDQILARELGLDGSVERTLVGFMGCYAAVAALRTARHIVRSDPAARVLVVMVELSTLHLQATDQIERLLAMLQFGDGAGAALVTAEPEGLAIERPFSATIPDSHEMIQWRIGDEGFVMELAGAVPGRIGEALADPALVARMTDGRAVDRWAVHAGGRSVLDAVERGLALPADALRDSRAVLEAAGNMSSATLMFVLARILADDTPVANGVAVAFGPGLAAEGFGFRRA